MTFAWGGHRWQAATAGMPRLAARWFPSATACRILTNYQCLSLFQYIFASFCVRFTLKSIAEHNFALDWQVAGGYGWDAYAGGAVVLKCHRWPDIAELFELFFF